MDKTALYRFYGEGDALLYVGMSQCPFQRSKGHERGPWYHEVRFMEVEWFDCRGDAANAERIAIDRERPVHNRASTHKPRKVAVTASRKVRVRAIARYLNMGPHLPPKQGPAMGNTYSVGLPDFTLDNVPQNHMFDCDLASIRRAINVGRLGDVLYVDDRIAVSSGDLRIAAGNGICVLTA